MNRESRHQIVQFLANTNILGHEQNYRKFAHYSDVTMSAKASQITSISTVCSAVCSGAHHRKHHSSISLAFVRGIHRWPVDSPHKRSVTRKMVPFGDVIMRHLFKVNFFRREVQTFDWFFACVANGPVDNRSTLVQVMAWCLAGVKTLPQLKLNQFTYAFMPP